MLIMKDLRVEDQKIINNILIARPITKVVIHSVSWEGGGETRLSGTVIY